MNGPLFLIRATVAFATAGMALWTRLLGPRNAKRFVIAGMGVSTVVVVLLEVAR